MVLRIGMTMGQDGSKGWGLCLAPHSFFLLHPCPLGSCETLPCKTLLLVNLLTTITIVFNKTYFVSKNILEITINLSYQIKLIFSKN